MNAPTSAVRPLVWWHAALIVLGALVAYANCFRAPFVFDDIPAIVENPLIHHLWPPPGLGGGAATGGLTVSGRPVFGWSLALNYALGGIDVRGYHAFNLLAHVLAGLALFGLLRRTLPRLRAVEPGSADQLALFVALLWTVHPLQTEAVTYVVQRAEVMVGLFYLLTLYAFARATDATPSRGWGIISIAACALGMATKEVMVTAPVVVWFYDRTFVAGSFAGALRARGRYYAALAATWLLLAALLWSTGGNRGGTVGLGVGVAPWAYALTQFEAVARYLWLSVCPGPLVFDYGTFWVTDLAEALPWALVVLAALAGTIWALARRPFGVALGWPAPAVSGVEGLGFAGACFFGILAPTSLTPGTIQMIVEHRMYLPLAAVLAALAIGLHAWLGRRAVSVLAIAVFACLRLTVFRNADYRDEFTLWSDTVAKRPHNAIALTNLGLAHFHAGRPAEAVREYERALREKPASVEAHYNLAIALARLGRTDEAQRHYEETLRLRPGFAAAHNNLGLTLAAAGRSTEAAAHYREALRLDSEFAEARHNLGDLLLQSGRAAEAIGEFEAALRLRPDYPEAHFNLGNACAQLDRMADAARHYEAALRARPGYVDAHVNLGNALLQLDRVAEAVQHFEIALKLNPAHVEAHNNLGNVFLRTGRAAEAVPHFREALRLRPNYAEAQRNLAEALAAPR